MTNKNTKPQRILVIATRQIGDVLLTTPLTHSLRSAYPNSIIDVLGYDKQCGMLEGNRDISNTIEIAERPTLSEFWLLLKKIYRRYNIAISTLAGDKPHFYAWLAAKQRIGVVESISKKTAWKRRSCQSWVLLDNINTHTVLQNLKLAACLNIPAKPIVSVPKPQSMVKLPRQKYAIIHPSPMWTYKQWTKQGWQTLIQHLLSKNLKVIISGGPDSEEKVLCEELAMTFPNENVESLAGKTSISELGSYIRNAACYIGPDTSITHMAAATACPTIALYGPSNVVKWGPWPANYTELENPYIKRQYPWQHKNNVLVIQGNNMPCVPCYEEGCDRHKQSQSKCLQTLSSDIVLRAVDYLLEHHSA